MIPPMDTPSAAEKLTLPDTSHSIHRIFPPKSLSLQEGIFLHEIIQNQDQNYCKDHSVRPTSVVELTPEQQGRMHFDKKTGKTTTVVNC